jgi:hypothetical protein
MNMDHRDYIAEMDALIGAWAKPAHCVPGVVAARIIETIDPVLLDGWLRERAPEILAAAIAKRKRSTATADRAHSGARAFEKARSEAASGDLAALGAFTVSYTVDAKSTRRKVADMTGADHEFVAASCESDAKSIALLAEFHRQVARKIGSKRTSDVLSEKQYDQLYRSIVRPRALEAVV